MRILLVGQCTLHWGRMEFGNIGNYYIIEPFVRQLHRVFPGSEIATTFQMSEAFCERENVSVLPMEYYYGWTGRDRATAEEELALARGFAASGRLDRTTPFIDAVLRSDLVIDFSGDIWGDNANFLGPDRFLVGLIKDRVAQLLAKPTVMLAGSPGPFEDASTVDFAKEVFAGFDLVTNREAISTALLEAEGFDVQNVESLACPAFIFEGSSEPVDAFLAGAERPLAGLIVCGWNFATGPFDKWPRPNGDYEPFADVVEFMTAELGLDVCLMSHSNGFPVPPHPFVLTHGRDFPVALQLAEVLRLRGRTDRFHLLENVLDAWQMRALLGKFDMLVSGRVHGAVGALSQHVPTVIIDYGHEPKAHKLHGFATVAQVAEYVVNPASAETMIEGIRRCWTNRERVRSHLKRRIPEVRKLVERNFDLLPGVVGSSTPSLP